MNWYAFAVGIITAMLIMGHFKRTGLERGRLAYPLLLASFPCYYFAFALYGLDMSALGLELLTSLVFLALVWWAIRASRRLAASLIALGCLLHGGYDALHQFLFLNPGTPAWWPEFCGAVDMILGGYLVYLAIRAPALKAAQTGHGALLPSNGERDCEM
ncbi:hypothetical protein [Shewanella cyperi]|uniref:hypothetical protein n=1 Tax=Shewanella cyperi TaxID=2814292 RepID=UPI001A950C1C|nr:hypothetical protein [Shewanella cyperi]QSX40565.1 hypothetical protein JYB84_16690 [Shewanella cyperi]